MSEYTPTTEDVRKAYAQAFAQTVEYSAEGFHEFDRWLAAHDAEVRAEAYKEES